MLFVYNYIFRLGFLDGREGFIYHWMYQRWYRTLVDAKIYEQMKFCDPWAYERMTGTYALREDYGYPVLAIDRPYAVGNSGQIRTRVQAFVESIEIKKLQGGVR